MCCSTILDWTLIDRTRSTCRSTSSEFQILSIDLAGFEDTAEDRKSTRLNSSHGYISYAVFCLKKQLHSLKLRYLVNHQEEHSPFRLDVPFVPRGVVRLWMRVPAKPHGIRPGMLAPFCLERLCG